MNDPETKKYSPVPKIFLSPYNPAETEKGIYSLWEKSGFFNPDKLVEGRIISSDAEVFSMVLPPPNVTGVLHMGSTLMLALEDVLVRRSRMQGKKTLWIPGTDSAAIATQSKVEKDIQKKEGKSRHDLGRTELLKRIDSFVEESKATILAQIRAVGASLDWSRYAYTMDEKRCHAVMEAFVRMYQAGLIYRGNRIVNWDPKGQTTISDDEIVYEERKAKLYTFKYSKDFPIAISTTRLETKVGDTAVAVHPDDTRYKEFVGKEYEVIFCGEPLKIKIVADEAVEKDFGTGALGVTPAHSQIDWEIADRHNLERKQVINEHAKMTVEGKLNNKKTTEAREIIAEWLRQNDLLISEEEIDQNISTAERTGGIIEPLPKLQWWIDVEKKFPIPYSEMTGIPSGSMTSLKEIMLKVAETNDINFVSKRFERTYLNWVKNLRPWCISRQIWFGHRVPVWYKVSSATEKGALGCRGEEMKVQIKSPGDDWEQDNDVLDTWFSSGLWTFTTLGWPEKTKDLQEYHPTNLIETGYDILPFWVARMIMLSGFFLGQVPFKTIYFHGLVRDGQGRKISKSLGNNIDPVDMAAKYGMDAVRVSLIMGTAPGADSRISEDKIRAYKHFANKLWNISRFVIDNTDKTNFDTPYTVADTKLYKIFKQNKNLINSELDKYQFHLAGEKIYHYIWDIFAAEVLEDSKVVFRDGDVAAIASRKKLLLNIFIDSLKVLHPFMPFVTEAIWQNLPEDRRSEERDLLMVASWPKN